MGFGFGSRTEHHQKSPAFASPSSTDADSESQTSSTKTCVHEEYQRETYEQITNKKDLFADPNHSGTNPTYRTSRQVFVFLPSIRSNPKPGFPFCERILLTTS